MMTETSDAGYDGAGGDYVLPLRFIGGLGERLHNDDELVENLSIRSGQLVLRG